jgi:2C-methyl-D-erythritol 2,4-cyclodiphosphate synthase
MENDVKTLRPGLSSEFCKSTQRQKENIIKISSTVVGQKDKINENSGSTCGNVSRLANAKENDGNIKARTKMLVRASKS